VWGGGESSLRGQGIVRLFRKDAADEVLERKRFFCLRTYILPLGERNKQCLGMGGQEAPQGGKNFFGGGGGISFAECLQATGAAGKKEGEKGHLIKKQGGEKKILASHTKKRKGGGAHSSEKREKKGGFWERGGQLLRENCTQLAKKKNLRTRKKPFIN